MVYGQGALAAAEGFLIREPKGSLRRNSRSATSSLLLLEEEIRLLRARMEELFEREQSLTSPRVVEASTRLDRKINDYMQRKGSR